MTNNFINNSINLICITIHYILTTVQDLPEGSLLVFAHIRIGIASAGIDLS